tara:strand:- start:8 stop:298 length:291 start_codon:yes stop_codon:yes gene_type:complete
MAFNDKQDEATLPRIPFSDLVQQGIHPVRRQRDGIRTHPSGGFGPDKGKCVHGKRSTENAGHPYGGPLEKSDGRKSGNYQKARGNHIPRTDLRSRA